MTLREATQMETFVLQAVQISQLNSEAEPKFGFITVLARVFVLAVILAIAYPIHDDAKLVSAAPFISMFGH